MRAIRINPIDKTITEIDIGPGKLTDLYGAMRADPAFSGTIDVVRLGEEGDLIVDDNGMCEQSRPVFHLIGDREIPIAGVAVVTGTDDEGDTIAAPSTVEAIAKLVKWGDLESTGEFGPSRQTRVNHPVLGPDTPAFIGGAPILRTRT